jgi:hypothetical protein
MHSHPALAAHSHTGTQQSSTDLKDQVLVSVTNSLPDLPDTDHGEWVDDMRTSIEFPEAENPPNDLLTAVIKRHRLATKAAPGNYRSMLDIDNNRGPGPVVTGVRHNISRKPSPIGIPGLRIS